MTSKGKQMKRKQVSKAKVKSSESTEHTCRNYIVEAKNLENNICRNNITKAGVLVWDSKAAVRVEVLLITFFFPHLRSFISIKSIHICFWQKKTLLENILGFCMPSTTHLHQKKEKIL